MNLYECFVCGDPQETKTCHRCRNGLRGDLLRLPLQWFALLDSRQRGQSGGNGGRSATRLNAPLPGNEAVLNLLGPASRDAVTDAQDQTGPAPLLETLWSWCAVVSDERGLTPVRRDFKEVLSRLVTHLPWIYERPWVRDFEEEIRDLVRATQKITMTEPRKELLRGVTCPGCSMLSLVRFRPGDWHAECLSCPSIRLDSYDYELLVQSQAAKLKVEG
ncbi:hypothetical protein AB0I87_13460 [Streptomyces sp. NPDC049952]|uniref:hypothetical protein n=1 Tax=Streptomyces sp. NPDC049952 TaxID=3156665 RepID=UPI00342BAC93